MPDSTVGVAALFRDAFSADPVGVWSAPGRVNLIGEHTDYSGGLVLPFAIDVRASVAIAPGAKGGFRIASAQRRRGEVVTVRGGLDPAAPAHPRWAGYVLGVVWALRERGFEVPSLDIALDSAVPAGAGLSSSAAVECAVALAISDHLELGIDLATLARIAQHAENDYVGVPCGLMDQMASAASTQGHALYFDTAEGTAQHIPFDTASAGLELLVMDTHAHHSLADGEYAKRRAETEQAAAVIGVDLLSQVRFANLEWALGKLADDGATQVAAEGEARPGAEAAGGVSAGAVSAGGSLAEAPSADLRLLQRRARHVITENQRVREAVALLEAGYIEALGEALSASHESLRDDFEVSCAELDLAAATAEEAGALGARMVGGGFGGSVIALVPARAVEAVRTAVAEASADAGYTEPTIRSVTPGPGALRDA